MRGGVDSGGGAERLEDTPRLGVMVAGNEGGGGRLAVVVEQRVERVALRLL